MIRNRQHIKQTTTKQPGTKANEGEIQTIFENETHIYAYNLRKQRTDSTHIDSNRVGEELTHFLFQFQFLCKFPFYGIYMQNKEVQNTVL